MGFTYVVRVDHSPDTVTDQYTEDIPPDLIGTIATLGTPRWKEAGGDEEVKE